jgi:hypothetical protein
MGFDFVEMPVTNLPYFQIQREEKEGIPPL